MDGLDEELCVGPCVFVATKVVGVRLVVGDYSRILTPDEADAFVAQVQRAAGDARATATLIASQPDGLARMGGNLFGKA